MLKLMAKITSAQKNSRQMFFYVSIALLLLCLLLIPLGCGEKRTMVLYTTTSVRDTGLLDELLPIFKSEKGIEVKAIAVGSGEAFSNGKKGSADALLIHDKKGEKDFMDGGYGSASKDIMYNYYVIIGPKGDPAGIKNSSQSSEAFKKIVETKSTFVSRGDDSGTNRKEKAIWEKAGITPSGDWYVDAGQSMAGTIRITNEKNGYTLSDKATYLSLKKSISLVILYEGGADLKNIYSVIVVNPAKFPKVKSDEATEFMNWMVSPETQNRIKNFGVSKYGEQLFYLNP